MGNKLREIGKTGIMIKKGYKRGDKGFDEALKNILAERLKAQAEKKKNKKDKKKKIKKISDYT